MENLPVLLTYPEFKLVIRIKLNKSYRYYYYSPELNSWFKSGYEFRNALGSLGLTERNWYNRWILNKSYYYSGPKCINQNCNNITEFHRLTTGYRLSCCKYCHNKFIASNNLCMSKRVESMKDFYNNGGPISKVLNNPDKYPESYKSLNSWYKSGGTFGILNKNPESYPKYYKYSTSEWCSNISRNYYDNIGNSSPSISINRSKFLSGWIKDSTKSHRAFYRSSWEALLMYKLEEDDNVKYYESEPFSIKYYHPDGSLHRYIPDLLVVFNDNSKLLVEIKADYLLDDELVKLKSSAAIEYCNLMGMDYIVISWNELKLISTYYDKLK